MSGTTTNPLFEVLSWDSGLFGFPVARIPWETVRSGALEDALGQMREEGIRLAYSFVPWHDLASRSRLARAGGLLANRHLRYRKDLQAVAPRPTGLSSWRGASCTSELEALAIASGHRSRFAVDTNVPVHVFEALYRTWIRRSVLGEIADDVLVLQESGRIIAMVTIALPEEHGTRRGVIGLLAASGMARGRGVGRRLVEACEDWCVGRGIDSLEVVTQADNTAACALYAACGARVVEDEAVFHLWSPSPGETGSVG